MTEQGFKVPAKKQIARAFGLKAYRYDANAIIQKKLLSILYDRLTLRNPQGLWLDLGCGTGTFEQLISPERFSAHFLGVDIAYESLRVLQAKQICHTSALTADIEALPFKNEAFSGVVMASVLQWFTDPLTILRRIYEVLRPQGTFLFATFTQGSFFELNHLRQEMNFRIPVHLPDENTFLSFLQQCHFDFSESERFSKTLYYPSALELLKSISAIGGTAISGERLPPRKLMQFCSEYEKKYRCERGVPITYRALVGSTIKGTH